MCLSTPCLWSRYENIRHHKSYIIYHSSARFNLFVLLYLFLHTFEMVSDYSRGERINILQCISSRDFSFDNFEHLIPLEKIGADDEGRSSWLFRTSVNIYADFSV